MTERDPRQPAATRSSAAVDQPPSGRVFATFYLLTLQMLLVTAVGLGVTINLAGGLGIPARVSAATPVAELRRPAAPSPAPGEGPPGRCP